MGGDLSDYAADRLRRRQVAIRLGVTVEEVGPERVVLSDESELPTETVVWTAGVRGSPRVEGWGLPVARAGRVPVTRDLNLEACPEVFVVGDLAYLEDDAGQPLPQVAPVAVQEGEHAARNVLALLRGEELRPFRFEDPGMLAVIGRNAAVARVFGRSFKGFLAWILWALVHIAKLVGFRNRALVLVNWAWNYATYRRAVRLILAGVGGRPDSSRD
jgi:NADH dehydrogenase